MVMRVNEYYINKASLPRSVRSQTHLRESLASWGTDRLLHVVNACQNSDDDFRLEFGRLHNRYANITFLITQAVPDDKLAYAAETLLVWLQEDFHKADTGPRREAAGICSAELLQILALYS